MSEEWDQFEGAMQNAEAVVPDSIQRYELPEYVPAPQSRAELYAALAKARHEMPKLVFNDSNPHFKSKFANLSAIFDCAMPALTANGLMLVQIPEFDGETVSLWAVLTHASGQSWEFSPLRLRPTKSDVHGIGSAITYAKRYQVAALMGLAADADDDGNGAVSGDSKPDAGKKPQKKAEPSQKPEASSSGDHLDEIYSRLQSFDAPLRAEVEQKVCEQFKVESIDKIPPGRAKLVLAFISSQG